VNARPLAHRRPAIVHLYCTDVREVRADVQERYLAGDDFARLANIAHPVRRAQYLAGRALLRFALQQRTGAVETQRLRAAPGGKLECIGGPAISLAHDEHFVACAVSDHATVGVDVQSSFARRSTRAIAEQFFCESEAEWLRGGEPERFYRLWVLKEAYLKAMGVGLAGGLDVLECRVDPPLIQARLTRAGAPTSLALLECPGAYFGVAALCPSRLDVRVERWQPGAMRSDAFDVPELIAATG
jgi:4'-phosphopantetheinyl transferase